MASESQPPLPPESADAGGPLERRSPPLPLTLVEAPGFQLERLNRDDYIPSVQPWIRHSSTILLTGAIGVVGFMAVMPYRVMVRGEGAVRPAGELVLINAPFDGRVRSIDVKPNQNIAAGQAIVSLDSSEGQALTRQYQQNQEALNNQVRAQSSQTTAELASAELEMTKARSARELAESEFRRYSVLAGSGAVPQRLYDEKKAVLDQASSSLAQASKQIDAIRARARAATAMLQRERANIDASLAEAQRRLRNTKVRSPVAGVVFKVEVRNPMQTVSAGQALASLAPSKADVLVRVMVRGEEIDNVRVAQHADLRLQGCPYPDFGTLPARVTAISPDAQSAEAAGVPTAGSSSYEVTLKPKRLHLSVAGRGCDVRLGMALSADITTRQESLLRFVLRKTRILVGG